LPHAHATSAHLSPPEKQNHIFHPIPDGRQRNSRRSSGQFQTVVRNILHGRQIHFRRSYISLATAPALSADS